MVVRQASPFSEFKMGKHYIPRFYLKGFTESLVSPYIWVYEKGKEKSYRTNIKNVAQEKKMYSEETESYLAQSVEQPAVEVVRKVRSWRTISPRDKEILADFMVVLLKRTPKGRERVERWFVEFAPRLSTSHF